ncbi:myosin heavy chain, clone 203-like isoform X4 [Syngnathus scovelli]|uniref:myosin heavy chain, clone 203-like isoform X4 n=1 Tax=Syngnathus scovelli TaxID=161590 RepID=UPI00210FB167|nr:uncharacterized protein LOC125991192 isoform X4 [Syngnathus scovelli]
MTQHVEAQPCRLPLGGDLDVKQSTEIKLQVLEKECSEMKEQNAKLIAEVQRLQKQREQDKMSLSKFSTALKNNELRTEEAQIELQQRDEVIQQSKLQLQQVEETVEEYSNVIKDLRLANQELRNHLEDREDEALLTVLCDLMEKKKESHFAEMSLAEELKLLATPSETRSMMVPSTDIGQFCGQEETDSNEATRPPTNLQQTNWCTQAKESSTQKVFIICMAIIAILVILAAGSYAQYFDFLPVHHLWRIVRLMLQPYFHLHYGALPPV